MNNIANLMDQWVRKIKCVSDTDLDNALQLIDPIEHPHVSLRTYAGSGARTIVWRGQEVYTQPDPMAGHILDLPPDYPPFVPFRRPGRGWSV